MLFLKQEETDEQAPQMKAGSPSPLAAFLAEAAPRYETLAQTLGLVDVAIRALEQDHLPRDETFWQAMAASLAFVKQATAACLASINEERFPSPVPDAIDAAAMKERVLLQRTTSYIDEVDLRLTAYQNRSSLAHRYLRQRQGVLAALRDLRRAGQDALKQSRVWRDAIREDVSSSQASSVTIAKGANRRRRGQRGDRPGKARKRHTANNSRGNSGAILQLVPREERRAYLPDTD